MKICIVSDTHGLHRQIKIPDCDLLIHAGDACNNGTMLEFAGFANWMADQTQAKNKVYVPGNHDLFVQEDSVLAEAMLGDTVKLLIDEEVDIDGIKVYGYPWTPVFYDWAFQANDGSERDRPRYLSMSSYLDNIPYDTDIIVSHGPPFAILDMNHQGDNQGSKVAQEYLKNGKMRPKIYCFGHIHESYGIAQHWGVTFVNAASSLPRNKEVRIDPVTIYLEADGSVSM